MKKNILMLIILILLTPLGCSGKDETLRKDDEEAAIKMFKNANISWMAGDEVGALKKYKRLAERFPDSQAKKNAEKRLEKKGISIGKPLMSWTIQRLTEMENELAENLFSANQYSSNSGLSTPSDAWGEKIFYKFYSRSKAYDFIVYSSGPDMKKGTDDDLAIVHYREKRRAPSNNYSYEEGSEDEDISNETVSLDDLKGMNGLISSDSDFSDNTMSLDQLRNEAKKGDFNEGSGDMELSLDEFKEFAK